MAIYYIDNVRGADSNNGLTKDTAWKSLENLSRGYGGSANTFLLESDSVWDYSTTDLASLKGDLYNTGANQGLRNTSATESEKTLISNYYYGATTSSKPTIIRKYNLLSNAQCKNLWKYSNTWQGWYINFNDFAVSVTDSSSNTLTFNSVTDAPHAGCTCKLTTTGTLPTGLHNVVISAYSWSNGIGTFTTSTTHAIQAGEEITVMGVVPRAINGTFTVLGGANSPTGTTFKVSQPLKTESLATAGYISYYAYPVTDASVRLYSNYADALAGNGNYKTFSGGTGTHTISFTPSLNIGNRALQDLMLINGEWGESFSQIDITTAPVPQKSGAYSVGYGTHKNYIYAPSNIDPVAHYGSISFLPSSESVFSYWDHYGVIIENIKFLNCVTPIVFYGATYTTKKVEVRNCISDKSASLVSIVHTPTADNNGFRGDFYDNTVYNCGFGPFLVYATAGLVGDNTISHAIKDVLMYGNYVNGCNQSLCVGGAFYIMGNAGLDGVLSIHNNHVLNAAHGMGNGHYDGAALYAEVFTNNAWFKNNLIENCPVPLQDNSGGKVFWVGNVMKNCGLAMAYTNSDITARDFTFCNNTIYNAVDMSSFSESLLRSSSVYRTSYTGATSTAIKSFNTGMSKACTFSGSLVTTTSQTAMSFRPVTFTTTGTLPSQIQAGVSYYPRKINTTTFKLFTTELDAYKNTNAITFSGGGTGTHTVTQSVIVRIKNNIFHAGFNTGKVLTISETPNITVEKSNNLFFGYDAQSSTVTSSVDFVKADPLLNADLKPLVGSPALNAGTKWWTGTLTDKAGLVYSDTNINLGAYQGIAVNALDFLVLRANLMRPLTIAELDNNFSLFGSVINTRQALGRALTHAELDANFNTIKTEKSPAATLTARVGLGRALTWEEMDANFISLKNAFAF